MNFLLKYNKFIKFSIELILIVFKFKKINTIIYPINIIKSV